MKITKLILAAYLLTSMAACDTDKNIAMYGEDSGAIRIEASKMCIRDRCMIQTDLPDLLIPALQARGLR